MNSTLLPNGYRVAGQNLSYRTFFSFSTSAASCGSHTWLEKPRPAAYVHGFTHRKDGVQASTLHPTTQCSKGKNTWHPSGSFHLGPQQWKEGPGRSAALVCVVGCMNGIHAGRVRVSPDFPFALANYAKLLPVDCWGEPSRRNRAGVSCAIVRSPCEAWRLNAHGPR